MNKQRLYDLIKNLKETLALLDKALIKLEEIKEDDLNTLIKSSIKQSFLEYFILLENFTSMVLKELKIYKISDDMEKSLTKLYDNNVIDSDMLKFLNEYRRYRNRIAHVYKQPSIEEIIEFININKDKIYGMVNLITDLYKGLE